MVKNNTGAESEKTDIRQQSVCLRADDDTRLPAATRQNFFRKPLSCGSFHNKTTISNFPMKNEHFISPH